MMTNSYSYRSQIWPKTTFMCWILHWFVNQTCENMLPLGQQATAGRSQTLLLSFNSLYSSGLGYRGNPAHVRCLLEGDWIKHMLLKGGELRALTRLLPFPLHTNASGCVCSGEAAGLIWLIESDDNNGRRDRRDGSCNGRRSPPASGAFCGCCFDCVTQRFWCFHTTNQ